MFSSRVPHTSGFYRVVVSGGSVGSNVWNLVVTITYASTYIVMSFQRTTCPSFNADRPTCLCRRLSRLFWITVQVFAMTNSTIERPSETRRAQAERGREIARVDDLLYFSLLLYSVGCSSHLEIPVYLPIESI